MPGKWWHGILHNSNAFLLKYYLGKRDGIVVTNVRYFLDADDGAWATEGGQADAPAGKPAPVR